MSPPEVIASGLQFPEGLAVAGDRLFVHEGESGRILELLDGETLVIATIPGGSAAPDGGQPSTMIFNGLTGAPGVLYATSESERALYRIRLDG